MPVSCDQQLDEDTDRRLLALYRSITNGTPCPTSNGTH